jgi:hypothetical protein
MPGTFRTILKQGASLKNNGIRHRDKKDHAFKIPGIGHPNKKAIAFKTLGILHPVRFIQQFSQFVSMR